jgi:hypothetical protein
LVFFPSVAKNDNGWDPPLARRRLLVFSSSAKDDNKLGSQLFIIFGCFASIVEDDNEFFGLLSFSTFFSSGVEDNNEPGGLLSFPNFFSLGVEKTTTS